MRTLPPVGASERIFMVGKTQSGKSTLARALFAAMPLPVLVIDPKDDVERTGGRLADRRDVVTFRDPGARLPPVGRFVPRDPHDLDAYDRLYRRIFASGPRWVWLDEAHVAAPAQGAPRGLRQVITQGAGKGLGHVALAQRPVHVDPNLIAQTEHLVVFQTLHHDDIRALAGVMAIAPSDLRAALHSLPRYGFLWYSGHRPWQLTRCQPLTRS